MSAVISDISRLSGEIELEETDKSLLHKENNFYLLQVSKKCLCNSGCFF